MKKNIIAAILSVALVFTNCMVGFADETEALNAIDEMSDNIKISEAQLVYVSKGTKENANSTIDSAYGVTEEMCEYSYWLDKSSGREDTLLMTEEEIKDLNNRAFAASKDTNMTVLENVVSSYNAKAIKTSLSKESTTKTKLYINGVEKNAQAYYKSLTDMILDTGYNDEQRYVDYAITVSQVDINALPTNDYVGYSATDTDNEIVSSAMSVGEPFIIKQKCINNGHIFYWGYSDNCTGWVDGDKLAICRDKEEWLDSFKVSIDADDFIVVTQDKIVLEPSYYHPHTSEVKLTIGSTLKLVPKDEYSKVFSAEITDRGPWNNYVVYLPTRDAEGKYVKSYALIAQHYSVSRGYLPMTKKNILKVAFSCLGNRYGWGGMLDAMDCSMYTRNIYRCFGVSLPRNTTWQQCIPDTKINMQEMKDEEKTTILKKLPAGTLIYFPGHVMMYTGIVNNLPYCISALGSAQDAIGDKGVETIYSVSLTPFNLRRKNGSTWLNNVTAAVCPFGTDAERFIQDSKVAAVKGESFASRDDNMPIDYSSGKITDAYISFNNIKTSFVDENDLCATVIKGTKLTTREAVDSVSCDKAVAAVKINKNTGCVTLKIKASGSVIFNMADGKSYTMAITSSAPKAAAAYKSLNKGSGIIEKSVEDLFNTAIDAGRLEIISDKNSAAHIENNNLILNTENAGSVKVRYSYLNKKYNMSIKIK